MNHLFATPYMSPTLRSDPLTRRDRNGVRCPEADFGTGIASEWPVTQTNKGRFGVFTSASPRCLDGGDVDLLHRHHRLEGTLCLTPTSGKRIG